MLTVYKASAGSGKTYTLAYEYIKLLLGKRRADGTYTLNRPGSESLKRPHSRILAITFTNKATAEMKSRILNELDALTKLPLEGEKDAPYAANLMAEYGCSRDELREVAELSLKNLLNDYSAFNISTIDAFFQTILRSFAREIDRQGDFRLELDQITVLNQAMSLLFDEINRNPDSAENRDIYTWLKEQASSRLKEGKDYNPFNRGSGMYRTIVRNLSQIFNEDFSLHEKEMESYLSEPSKLTAFNKWLSYEISRIKKSEKEATDDLLTHGYLFGRYLNALINRVAEEGEMTAATFKPIRESKQYITAIRDGNADGIFIKGYKASDEDVRHVTDWLETVEKGYLKRLILEEISGKINTLWALFHIHRFIDRYRVENNLILISDTNSLLGTIIDGSEIPFIYEKVGVQLENFLIDEFQDTSRLQWRNLKPLLDNSFGGNNDSLIIGDEKQSIYRWRGGDPDLLAHKVAESDFPRQGIVRGSKEGENTNYRSAHDIVRFNNTLFKRLATYNLDVPVSGYEGVAQALGPTTGKIDAHIRINNLLDFERYADARDEALKMTAEAILDQLKRGYRPSDIAILCRENKVAAEIAEYLGRNYKEIRLVSDEALLLCNSRAVKMIVSMLEIIERSLDNLFDPENGNPAVDDNDLTEVPEAEKDKMRRRFILRKRRAVLADSFEYYLAHGKGIDEALKLALEASNRVGDNPQKDVIPTKNTPDIAADLAEIRRIAPSNLSALVQAIINLKLTDKERHEEMPYITAFVDMVDEFMQDYTPSIHSFLSYWNENKHKKSIPSGTGENAVTIITVHQAKGLEWPCVHIPLLKWKFQAAPSGGWFDMSGLDCPEKDLVPPVMYLETNEAFGHKESPFLKQYLQKAEEESTDNLNVAYVAFTRAVRELHVNLVAPDRGRSSRLPHAISDILQNASSPSSGSAIFMDFSPFVQPDGSFLLGDPTTPMPEKKGNKEIQNVMPAPDFYVSFNPLNQRLTRLSDLTFGADIDDTGDSVNREIVDEPGNSDMVKAAREGLILHAILSDMVTADDLEEALDFRRREIGEKDLDRYRETILKAFRSAGDDATRWFSHKNPRVLNEQSIFHKKTGKTYRADRIIWLPDGSVEIIDYKFTSTVRPSHYEQVRDYATSLRSMGYGPVRAYLWYPLLEKIIKAD